MAVYFLGSNIIMPMMSDDIQIADVPDLLDDGTDSTSHHEVRSLHSVDTSQLFWNDSPQRNPFVPQSRINSNALSGLAHLRGQRNTEIDNQHTPVISGLVAGIDSKFAVLDGHIVSVGERINEYKVVSINSKGVKLAAPGRSSILTLSMER